jgi:hypothetical protein
VISFPELQNIKESEAVYCFWEQILIFVPRHASIRGSLPQSCHTGGSATSALPQSCLNPASLQPQSCQNTASILPRFGRRGLGFKSLVSIVLSWVQQYKRNVAF